MIFIYYNIERNVYKLPMKSIKCDPNNLRAFNIYTLLSKDFSLELGLTVSSLNQQFKF